MVQWQNICLAFVYKFDSQHQSRAKDWVVVDHVPLLHCQAPLDPTFVPLLPYLPMSPLGMPLPQCPLPGILAISASLPSASSQPSLQGTLNGAKSRALKSQGLGGSNPSLLLHPNH